MLKLYRIEVLLHVVISAAYDLQNTQVSFFEILGLHDDEESYCALVDYYTLQPGGWVRNSEGTAFYLNPEDLQA